MATAEPRTTRSRVRQMANGADLLTSGKAVPTSAAPKPARRPRATQSRSAKHHADSTLLDLGDGLPESHPEEDPLREALRRSASGRPGGAPSTAPPSLTSMPSTSTQAVASPARRSRRVQAKHSGHSASELYDEGSPFNVQSSSQQATRGRRADEHADDGHVGEPSQSSSTLIRRSARTSGSSAVASPSELTPRSRNAKRSPAREQQVSEPSASGSHRSSEERLAELRLRIRKAAGESTPNRKSEPSEAGSETPTDGARLLSRAQSQGGLSARERLQERRRRREEERRLQRATTQQTPDEHPGAPFSKETSASTSGLSRRHSTYDHPPAYPSERQAKTQGQAGSTSRPSSTAVRKRSSLLLPGPSLFSPGPRRGSSTEEEEDAEEEPESRARSSIYFSEQRRPFEGGAFKEIDAMTAEWIAGQQQSMKDIRFTDSASISAHTPLIGDRATQLGHTGRADSSEDDENARSGSLARAELGLSKTTSQALASLEASLSRLGAGKPLVSTSAARKRHSVGVSARRKSSDGSDDEAAEDLSTRKDCARQTGTRVVDSSNIDAQRSSSPRMPAVLRPSARLAASRDSSAERKQMLDADAQGARHHHQRRLLGSEKGADEAGNSPRKQPSLDFSSTHIASSSSSSSSQQRLPTFLERARAARDKSRRTVTTSEDSPDLPGSASSVLKESDHYASARESPALPVRRRTLTHRGSSDTPQTSDEEDEARVERELTPVSESDPHSAISSPSGLVRAHPVDGTNEGGQRSFSSSPGGSVPTRPVRRRSLFPSPFMSATSSPSGRFPHQNSPVTSTSTSMLPKAEFTEPSPDARRQPIGSVERPWRGLGQMTLSQAFILKQVQRVSPAPSIVQATLFGESPEKTGLPLKGAVALIDVRNHEGVNTSDEWVGKLAELGARTTTGIPLLNSRQYITHMVWKNGRPSTLKYFKSLPVQARPVMVGVGWVKACEAGRGWAKEEDHLCEYGRDSLVQLHRQLSKKTTKKTTTTATTTPPSTPQGSLGPAATTLSLDSMMLPPTSKWVSHVRLVHGYEVSRCGPLNGKDKMHIEQWGMWLVQLVRQHVDGWVFEFDASATLAMLLAADQPLPGFEQILRAAAEYQQKVATGENLVQTAENKKQAQDTPGERFTEAMEDLLYAMARCRQLHGVWFHEHSPGRPSLLRWGQTFPPPEKRSGRKEKEVNEVGPPQQSSPETIDPQLLALVPQ